MDRADERAGCFCHGSGIADGMITRFCSWKGQTILVERYVSTLRRNLIVPTFCSFVQIIGEDNRANGYLDSMYKMFADLVEL